VSFLKKNTFPNWHIFNFLGHIVSQYSVEGPMNLTTFIVTHVLKCHIMSQCVISILFHSVTHVMGVTLASDIHLSQISLSCVIGRQMCHRKPFSSRFELSLIRWLGVGQKVIPRPSATTS
jgi:hypothetical protein